MGCDIFSLIGIENIANWISKWKEDYDHAYTRTGSQHGSTVDKFSDEIRNNSNSMARFIGYTVQQYITKTIRNEKRATGAYEAILRMIPDKMAESLGTSIAPPLGAHDVRLGDVPHMFSLVPLAQTAHTPIHKLTGGDGLSGGQYQQQRQYKDFIQTLSSSLMQNLRRSTEHSSD
jgi:hypothetical protein